MHYYLSFLCSRMKFVIILVIQKKSNDQYGLICGWIWLKIAKVDKFRSTKFSYTKTKDSRSTTIVHIYSQFSLLLLSLQVEVDIGLNESGKSRKFIVFAAVRFAVEQPSWWLMLCVYAFEMFECICVCVVCVCVSR